jgi:hypothetical protein
MTLFLLFCHFPRSPIGGIGKPFLTTSRSRLVLKYTSTICCLPKTTEHIASEQKHGLPKYSTEPVSAPRRSGTKGGARGLRRGGLFQYLVLERDAFRIVLFEPLFPGIHICEYPNVVFVSDLLARVDDGPSSGCAKNRSYLIRCASMASQAVSASAYVLKGDPPTLIAGLLIWMGAKKLQSRACREAQAHLYSRY